MAPSADERVAVGRSGWRRRRLAGLVGLGLACVVAVGGWWIYSDVQRRHYRPELRPGEVLGLDVSHYQGEIDWDAVASDDIDFAYIKSTEAGDWVDETFERNWTEASRVGLSVGAYHFFTLCRTGADQAANFLRVVPFEDSDLPPAIDLEFPNNCSARPSMDALQRELAEFLAVVEEATGRTALLYVEDEFDDMYGIFDAFDQPTWERSLRRRPEDDRWIIWQASDAASVAGVDGGVDLNLMSAGCCP